MSKEKVAALAQPDAKAEEKSRSDHMKATTGWKYGYVSTVGLVASRVLSACVMHGLDLLVLGHEPEYAAAQAVRLLDEGAECMAVMGYSLADCEAELREALRIAFGDAIAPACAGEVKPTPPRYLPGLRQVYVAAAARLADGLAAPATL